MLIKILFLIFVILDVFWLFVVSFNILEWILQTGEDYTPFPKEWSFIFLIHVLITLVIKLSML